MINIKSREDIKIMQHGGKILAETLKKVLESAEEGISEIELDKIAEDLIIKKGAEPGFKRVEGYKNTLCVSTNDVVVHGVPREYKLKKGDVVGIDCGVFYKGLNTDMSETIIIGNTTDLNLKRFVDTGKLALSEAIDKAVIGNRVGDISRTIQRIVEREGYSVVKSLIGHGVGKTLHEDPEVPGYLHGAIEDTPRLTQGMTIAVEVIYNQGSDEVVYSGSDNWTISTRDKKLSGLFERSIAIVRNGPMILTK